MTSRNNGPRVNGGADSASGEQAKGETRRIFHLQGVAKRWEGEHGFLLTVQDLTIMKGEKVALVGFSGCGKSTLLDILAMVLRPDSAAAFLFSAGEGEGLDVNEAWRRNDLDLLASTRLFHMGYVLQTGGLLPFLSVRENIGLSRRGLGLPVKDAVEKIAGQLGIERHLDKVPGKLSVGERQRVAIARAMVHDPSVVIADEPTASLDPITSREIMALFTDLADECGVTLIVATHDWRRVDKKHGFRHVNFNVKQDATEGTIQAVVSS